MHVRSPARSAPTRGHLFQVDLVRVLTFASVIGVHSTAGAFAADSENGNALELLLHFTREGFFCLSTFVLLHAYRHRPLHPRTFWPRRFLLVGAPYLAWSLIYELIWLHRTHQGWGALPAKMRFDVLSGAAEYHLYFLLVTLQVYLLLPLLLALVRRTAGHHLLLLTGSVALQAAISALVQYGRPTNPVVSFYLSHAYELFISYQLWIVLGALTAFHLERVQRVFDSYGWAIIAGSVGAGVLAQVLYRWAVRTGTVPDVASSIFQPVLIPAFIATIAGLYALSSRWAAWRKPGRVTTAVDWASQASFGIYLVHPAILDAVVPRLPTLLPGAPPALLLVVLWLVAATGSAIFVAVVRRTPLSLPLTGRPWARRRAGAPPTPPAAPPATTSANPSTALPLPA